MSSATPSEGFLRLVGLASRVSYPGLTIQVGRDAAGCWQLYTPFTELHYLRVSCPEGVCTKTGEPAPWKGRKWRLSEHMTDGEVVSTAFKAIITALEHEARELFKFDGQPVYDSHIDIHKLVALHRGEGATIERSPL